EALLVQPPGDRRAEERLARVVHAPVMERRRVLPGPAPHVLLVIDVQRRPVLARQIPDVDPADREHTVVPLGAPRPDRGLQRVQVVRRPRRMVLRQDVGVKGTSWMYSTHIRSLGVSPITFSPLPRTTFTASARPTRPACTAPGSSSPFGTAGHRSCTSWYAPATLSKHNISGLASRSRSACFARPGTSPSSPTRASSSAATSCSSPATIPRSLAQRSTQQARA